jgi:PASTA domain
MRGWVSWGVWALLLMILLTIPAWFGWSSFNSLPHARALAGAYAASPDCQAPNLLRAAAPQLTPSSAAPAGTLCEVRSMTAQRKWRSPSSYVNSGYTIILRDEAGREFDVLLDDDDGWFWRDIQPPVRVNVQWVEGKVAMIADGTKVARTADQPDVMLHTDLTQLRFSGLLSIPFFLLLAISVKAWVKKVRRVNPESIEQVEIQARLERGAPQPTFECPNFQGRPLPQARQELEAAGYKVGRISFMASPSSPAGAIVAQTPVPGAKIALGTAFDFQVSTGGKASASNA